MPAATRHASQYPHIVRIIGPRQGPSRYLSGNRSVTQHRGTDDRRITASPSQHGSPRSIDFASQLWLSNLVLPDG